MADSTDPRVTRSREAILSAARELLREDGPAAVTHQNVAKRAGVGRATVYRHWPQPRMLLDDTMSGVRMPFFRDPVPPVRPWLARQMRTLADELALPEIQAVTAALFHGAPDEPDRREQLIATISGQLGAALESAALTGELRDSTDLADAPALLIGPMVFRSMFERRPVTDAVIDHLLESIGTWSPPADQADVGGGRDSGGA